MSGGSWDYVSYKVEDIAERLIAEKCPLRRALGIHIRKIAEALHDIEWVDSGDMSEGQDRASIERALGSDSKALEIECVKEDARRIIKCLERLTGAPPA